MTNIIAEAEKYYLSGEVERARSHFEKALAENPYNAEVLNNLGVIAHESGDPYTAEAYFLRAIENDADSVDGYLNLLPLLCEIGSVARAALLAEFMLDRFAGNEDIQAQTMQVVEFLAMDFAKKLPELMAGYWHDRNILKYSELFQHLCEKSDRIQEQNAHAKLTAALAYVARNDDYPRACKHITPHFETENLMPVEYLLLSCFWFAAERIYESRLYASFLLDDEKFAHLARALIDAGLTKVNSQVVAAAYKKILVVMDEGIGNMVMLTPSLQGIRRRFPSSEITVLCKKLSAQIIDGLPFVDKTVQQLADDQYDLVLCSIWSQNFLSQNAVEMPKKTTFAFTAPFKIGIDHEVEANFRLANFLGCGNQFPLPQVAWEPCEMIDLTDRDLAIIANTTVNNDGWERKRWPHYAALAEKLLHGGYQVAVVGGDDEASKFSAGYWPAGVLDLQGKLNLKETAGLIKQAALFVGNDSGPAHIAAALAVPTYVLFGASNISKNRPLGKNVHVLTKELPCSPCQYTERWKKCTDWQCMAKMSADWVFDHIKGRKSQVRCLLSTKETEKLTLVRRQNRLFVKSEDAEEPLRIHLVGKSVINFPWGMEIEVARVFERLGCEVITTDYVAHANDFSARFFRPAHLMLVFRGSGIPGQLIRRVACKSVLWYQDDVFAAPHVQRDLAFNARFFDKVYSFDKNAIDEYKKYGVKNIDWLPLGATPEIYHKQYLPKKYDVSFVGNIYENRQALFKKLEKKFNLYVTQAFARDAAGIYNQSKIVLNLGIGKTGIQQRVFEVLCCGSLLFTSEIPSEGRLFKDKKHLIYFNDENIEELLAYYLQNEEEREEIALAGYREALAANTFTHRAEKILRDHFNYNPVATGEGTSVIIQRDRKVIPGFVPVDGEKLNEKLQQRKLRIFTAFRQFNWENENLQPALEKFGEVVRYDWYPDYCQYNKEWHLHEKQEMNQKLFNLVRDVHYNGGIDLFFSYLSGRLVFPATIRAIRKMGIPTVNLYLDDVKGFWGNFEPTGFSSMIDIAGAFDLGWTNFQEAQKWYASQGTEAVFLPSGANPDIYKPLQPQVERDIDVLFIGQRYGRRPKIIEFLQQNGIAAQAFGKGWKNGEVSIEKMIELYNRAKIVLGMGEACTGGVKKIQIKGRDFEVPMSGALYLTQANPELEPYFEIGEEIAVYRDENDLLEKARFYLANPQVAEKMRQNARKHCVAEHSWEARFQAAFEKLVQVV